MCENTVFFSQFSRDSDSEDDDDRRSNQSRQSNRSFGSRRSSNKVLIAYNHFAKNILKFNI